MKKNKKEIKNKKNKSRSSKYNNLNENKKVVKKRRFRFGRFTLFLIVLFLIGYFIVNFVKFPIKNIYVSGNNMLSDQEIIELAKIAEYPSIFKYTSKDLKNNILKNTYITEVKIRKNLTTVYIEVLENKPLFFDSSLNKTVLYDESTVDATFNIPVLINYVPDTLYKTLIKKLKIVDDDIIDRISEIKYDANDVDNERFLLTMSDGNYVYVTLNNFEKINDYVDINKVILETYLDKKGILYLDEGEYFEVISK